MSIHSTATVNPGAELGEGVVVGPGAVIGGNVRIGSGSRIGANAVIHEHTTLGSDCRVHACAVIGDVPQDLVFQDVVSHVRIGDGVTLREGVTVHRGTKEGTETVIGDGCYLMANSHVAHNVILGNKVILVNGALLAGYVEVGDGAFVSGNVCIHQFCKIGRLAMIGGLGAISKDVLPFCTTATGERNLVAGLNIVGLRRAGFTPADRKAVKQCFEIIYRNGLNTAQALDQLKAMSDTAVAAEFIQFIEQSDRGLCAFAGSVRDDG